MRAAVDGYEEAVRSRDWAKAVSWDLQFHTLLIRFHGNRRLESFYQKVIGELRMGMVLVDRSHDNPGGLVPVHRKLYQLLLAGKLKQCAAILAQHLDDSESRLGRIMAGQRAQPPGLKPSRGTLARRRKTSIRVDGRGTSAVAGG